MYNVTDMISILKSWNKDLTLYSANCSCLAKMSLSLISLFFYVRLLRSAAGFVLDSNVALHPETPLKRVSYVRCCVKLMCRCSHHADIPPEHYAVLTTNLLTEVEAVIGTSKFINVFSI